MAKTDSSGAARRAAKTALLALDVDGTLTDGRIVIGADGELAKFFSVHDGLGLRLLMDSGISVGIITARDSAIVRARANELRIPHVMQGVANKADALTTLMSRTGHTPEQTAFMGDDLPDLAAMRIAGLAACVANAADEVRHAAHWVASRPGGHGAVRELSEFVLRSCGLWENAIARFTGPGNP